MTDQPLPHTMTPKTLPEIHFQMMRLAPDLPMMRLAPDLPITTPDHTMTQMLEVIILPLLLVWLILLLAMLHVASPMSAGQNQI